MKLLSATSSNESELLENFEFILAEEESRRLSARVMPSKKSRAKQGKWGGQAPFGYRTEASPDGKGRILIPDEVEAEIVRDMFVWCASGQPSLWDLSSMAAQRGKNLSRYAIGYLLI